MQKISYLVSSGIYRTNLICIPEVLLVQQEAGWDAYDKGCWCQQQLQQATVILTHTY
jgi:hypothetical protein